MALALLFTAPNTVDVSSLARWHFQQVPVLCSDTAVPCTDADLRAEDGFYYGEAEHARSSEAKLPQSAADDRMSFFPPSIHFQLWANVSQAAEIPAERPCELVQCLNLGPFEACIVLKDDEFLQRCANCH